MRTQGIYFVDFLDFLSIELQISRPEVQNIIRNNKKDAILTLFKKSSPNFFYNDVRLNKPILDSHGNILLHKDVEFLSYIPSLVDWVIKNPDKRIGPFEFQSTDSLINYYKGKILVYFDNLIEKLKKPQHNKYSYIITKCGLDKNLKEIESSVLNLIENVIEKPLGINLIINTIAKQNVKTNPLEYAINNAFIAMAIMKSSYTDTKNYKSKLKLIGMSALFQNISDIHNIGYDIEHPIASAKIAEELGLAEQIVDTICNHHMLEDEDGVLKVFNTSMKNIPQAIIILTNVNLFMDICSSLNSRCNDLEVFKVFWVASANGYADHKIADILTKLFLEDDEYKKFARHLKIIHKCDITPIIWSMKGNTVPTKFLCNVSDCKSLSTQATIISNDIIYKHRNREIVFIKKGVYYTCSKLENLKKNICQISSK